MEALETALRIALAFAVGSDRKDAWAEWRRAAMERLPQDLKLEAGSALDAIEPAEWIAVGSTLRSAR